MAGVLIYKNALGQHYSFVIAENKAYTATKLGILENESNKILWEKENVSSEQIEKSRKTKNDLVKRLNEGQEVDLEKELSIYFVN